MPENHFYHISKTGEFNTLDTLEQALVILKEGEGTIWLDYFQPSLADLNVLIDPLDLHPLAIEDCLDEMQVPKIEDFPNNTFVLFNTFDFSNNVLSIDEVDFFISSNFLITVSGSHSEGRHPLQGVQRIVMQNIDSARKGPSHLLQIILDYVVDHKFLALDALEDELNKTEEAVLNDVSSFDPSRLLDLRRDLLNLRKSLFHEREILVKMCRKDCPFISGKVIYNYRDIYDHLAKFFEFTETYRDMATSLMEIYLSILNNNMARASNNTNRTVRRLTYITTIFMPMTLLAGIGGMSEYTMMTGGEENWQVAYTIFLIAMVAIGFISYFLLKQLEKRDRQRD